ncbi:MAG: nucleotidyltransferase family protein [Candidatus Pacearchaeota archaeon]|jgi:hypothetical protein
MKVKENKSLFLEYLGDTPQLRVLDFLIDNDKFDYPMTVIAKNSNVSYNSIKKFFNNFIKSNIIIKTRKVGKSDYFKLNLDNSLIINIKEIKLNKITKKNFNKSLNIDEIKNKIIRILKSNDVIRAGLFGSYARGDYNEDSDLDILVEFKGNKSIFDISKLKLQLEDEINKSIDIITYKSINPLLKKEILLEEIKLL